MTTSPSDNLRHWGVLGQTDPAHTKPFTRPGGFKGTAIKPIWTEKRMTGHFGPCGIGWGMGQPEFQLVPAGEEIMVYSTVRLWYVDAGGVIGECWGVGGDKVRSQQPRGLSNNDEAFKSAYTDALSNAMKHLGVGADVHMGLFDDNKYVRDVSAALKQRSQPSPKPSPEPARDDLVHAAWEASDEGSRALEGFWISLKKKERVSLGEALLKELKERAVDRDQLRELAGETV